MFNSVNGLIFPGGLTDLWMDRCGGAAGGLACQPVPAWPAQARWTRRACAPLLLPPLQPLCHRRPQALELGQGGK